MCWQLYPGILFKEIAPSWEKAKKINTSYFMKHGWYLFLFFHSMYVVWMIFGLTFTQCDRCGTVTERYTTHCWCFDYKRCISLKWSPYTATHKTIFNMVSNVGEKHITKIKLFFFFFYWHCWCLTQFDIKAVLSGGKGHHITFVFYFTHKY